MQIPYRYPHLHLCHGNAAVATGVGLVHSGQLVQHCMQGDHDWPPRHGPLPAGGRRQGHQRLLRHDAQNLGPADRAVSQDLGVSVVVSTVVEGLQLLAVSWGMDGIKKRSDCVDCGFGGCSCLLSLAWMALRRGMIM